MAKKNLITRAQRVASANFRGQAGHGDEDWLGQVKEFHSEFVVRVWPNGYKSGDQKSLFKIPNSRIGHAAITFRQQFGTGTIAGVYVSWWPSGTMAVDLSAVTPQRGAQGGSYFLDKVGETGKRARLALQKPGSVSRWNEQLVDGINTNKVLQRVANHRTLGVISDTDGDYYQTSSTHKDYLPGLMLEEDVQGDLVWWGLCGARVTDWWGEFVDQAIYYGASLRYSCAGAAATALEVAGAGAFAPKPGGKVAKFYMAPMNLMVWAEDLRQKLERLNGRTAQFANQNAARYDEVMRKFRSTERTNLWSYQEFRDASRLGWKYPRSSIVKNIDRALQRYHDAGELWEDNFEEKLKNLRILFENIYEHVQNKPTSKRTVAIRSLGCQVLGVLRRFDVVNCNISNTDKFL